MTPVARLVLTFFAAFPVQRALIVAAVLGGVAAACIALVTSTPPAPLRWPAAGTFAAALAFALVTFPTFLACGTLFAALSAPRTFLLLPHFRRRMLTAMLVVFAAGSLPVVALAYYAPQPVTVAAVLGYGFAFFTVLALATTLPPAMFVLIPLVLVPALHLADRLDALAGTVVAPAVLAAASAIAWTAFAKSYLRGKPIRALLPLLGDILSGNPAPPPGKLTAWQLWITDTSAPALTRNGFRVLLNGQLPARPRRTLATLAAIGMLLTLWIAFFFRLVPKLGEAPLFLLPFVYVPLNAFVAARGMRRARLLWLLGPERMALFRIVEKTFIRPFLAFGGSLAALTFALAVWHEGLPPAAGARVAAALVGYGALAAYAGLLFARGFGAAALLAAVPYTCLYVYTLLCAVDAAEQGPALAGSTVFALVAAGLCRYAALRRWHEIDWIALRPPRGASQRARTAGV